MPPVLEGPPESIVAILRERLASPGVVVATAGGAEQGRMLGLPPATIAAMRALEPGLIAVEADGSAHKPFKAPAEHEPVIPGCATHAVACVGLEVLGKELGERYVHRPEIVAALTGLTLGQPVPAEAVLEVLLHERGGRKGVAPGQALCALLNNPVDDAQAAVALELAHRLIDGGYERVLVGSAHRRGSIELVAIEPAAHG
jgi:probable selenium-dependent hydroxylase accessory protein YqeC